VDWAVGKLKAAGLAVTTESYTVPGLWLGGTAEASCVAPEAFGLRVVSTPFSPSTPGGKPLEARLVDAGEGMEADFQRLGPAAKGAIALVRTKEMKTVDDLFGEYMNNAPIQAAAAKAQVAGILLQSSHPRGLLDRHPITLDASLAPFPIAMVSREEAGRLSRLCEAGEVKVRLALANKTGGAYTARNVVAEIKGREHPEEVVVLGAHLDSWELGTGANDNGVNAALVIDVARGMKELGLTPRRTIRFVLFTGEEQGMWGSRAYVKDHEREMDRHVAAVVFDVGSGRTSGFFLNGREDLRKPVDEVLGAVSGLGSFVQAIDAIDGTDNFDFMLEGVPNLVANQDFGPYTPDYHAESDTFDKVDGREAQANEAIAAAVVWGLADRPERAARRQTREEVEKLIVDTKLEPQLRAFGQWDEWAAGKRGLPKR
jgi:Iap family predicted aminopeptidase